MKFKTKHYLNGQTKCCLLVILSSLVFSCVAPQTDNLLEPFSRQADYNYFLPLLQNANLQTVDLNGQGFLWPDQSQDGDTVLLEFQLAQARGDNPSLRISYGNISYIQSFESGGSGIRYLDLTPLLASGIEVGEFVAIESEGASWENGESTLAVFNNGVDVSSRTLVIAPHPDDAEIAAYGFYRDAQADVVTITAGDAGGENFAALWPNAGDQFREKGKIRTLDSLTVPLLAGLETGQVKNLGYYDATLERLWRQRPSTVPTTLAELDDPAYFRKLNFDRELRDRRFVSTWPLLVEDLLNELETVQPDIVVAPHPFLDRHGDHKFTAIALFEALHRWNREITLLLYTNHAAGNEAFPLGPRQALTGVPAWDEDNLYITGIYSHLLDEQAQSEKLIALEAMHDLRPFDPRDGSAVQPVDSLYDYFRRGPRPNELFLVTNLLGARVIRGEFIRSVTTPQLQLGM